MCACLPLHSSHQPAEVPAVKWDHTAGQAQHLLSGLTGKQHTLAHTHNTCRQDLDRVQCTMEISFTGICVCSRSKTRARCCISGAACSPTVRMTQITHESPTQRRRKRPNRLRLQKVMQYKFDFPLEKSIFGLFFFSPFSCCVLFVWEWTCWPSNGCLFMQVVNLFNMFITYGDTFLPTSNSYDELYYEIVRMHQVFDNLYCMGMLKLQCLTCWKPYCKSCYSNNNHREPVKEAA